MITAKDTTPYFQYQFDSERRVIGAEILLRPKQGNIVDFVRDLESKNEIHLLDLLAFETALKLSKSNQVKCSCNFSAITMNQPNIVEKILFIYEFNKINQQKIILELTEGRLLNELEIANINKLIDLGFNLALDDYGKEYSGLNRLYSLDFDQIKIDKYLIEQIHCTKAYEIIKSTLNLGDRLCCDVVAEGVETELQFRLLKELGCKIFQGYYLHRPQEILGDFSRHQPYGYGAG